MYDWFEEFQLKPFVLRLFMKWRKGRMREGSIDEGRRDGDADDLVVT